MKKIYPKEWLELHPYKQTNSVDQYYVGIANEIHKRLYSSTIAKRLRRRGKHTLYKPLPRRMV